jgi:hypothetical protein
MRCLVLVFTVLGVSLAWADEANLLKGPDILSQLAGKTVRGTYADGTAFTETFWPDGKDSYWDPRGTSTGRWSIATDLMCFEYDLEYNMAGGCFRVQKIGANCFEFYVSKLKVDDVPSTDKKPRYVARASADGVDGVCPVALQV